MRNLDVINPLIARPNKSGGFSFVIPLIVGLVGSSFADGVAPSLEVRNNYLSQLGLILSVLAIVCAFFPYIFKWDWEAKYFGIPSFCIGSASGFGIFPMLAIVIYGAWPPWARMGLLLANTALIVWWCRRFVLLYRKIYNEPKFWRQIYIEENDAVYYSQQGDKQVIERHLKFAQFPSNFFTILPMAFAFLLLPFMGAVKNFVGAPFPHIFLTIAAIPINLLCLGLATRGFLIFYYYPSKIKRETGKSVYVDMATTNTKR